eukprot:UN02054
MDSRKRRLFSVSGVSHQRINTKRKRKTLISFGQSNRNSSKTNQKRIDNVTYLKPVKRDKKIHHCQEIRKTAKKPFKTFYGNERFDRFKRVELLGKGSYGMVYKVKLKVASSDPKINNQFFAIKIVPYKARTNPKRENYLELTTDVYRELAVSNARGLHLKKEFIIPLREVIFGAKECWLIYPCYDMDLTQFLNKLIRKKAPRNFKRLKLIFHQCVKAVGALHDR